MKKILLLSIMCLCALGMLAQHVIIKFDTGRAVGEIDPNIYGVFMEPIGRSTEIPVRNTLYGTLYDPSSPLANADGFKTNYINALRELKITNMRWPGGNYLSGYNWQDGIGPKDQRPMRKDIAWGGYDPNTVGTDEWVALNRAIGSENVICINLGLGSIDDARYWIEYTNEKQGTYYSNLRARYGHLEPYNVKYWCLGNELDGAPWIMGHKEVDDYVKLGVEAAKALKAVDASIELVANGSSYYEATGKWLEWNRKVVTAFTGVADYLSIHRYWHDAIPDERKNDYYAFVGEAAMDFEEKIRVSQALVEVARALYPEKTPLKLSVDEWGAFTHGFGSVIATAQCLNSFLRHADFVKMANMTMATSFLSIDKESGNTFKAPLFHAFKLFSNNCRGVSLDTYVKCETFAVGRFKEIPYLDVTCVKSEDGKTVYVNVVNRHKTDAITAEISDNASAEFGNKATVSLLEGKMDDTYTAARESEYVPKVKEVAVKGNKLICTFPACSLTQIVIPLK